jgi:hypothetical protein
MERRAVAGSQALHRESPGVEVAALKAENQALNETESSVRIWRASRSARLAFVRSAEAFASDTEDPCPTPARGVAGISRQHRDEREQQRLEDRQDPVVPVPPGRPGVGVPGVAADLFAHLGWGQALRHLTGAPAYVPAGSYPRRASVITYKRMVTGAERRGRKELAEREAAAFEAAVIGERVRALREAAPLRDSAERGGGARRCSRRSSAARRARRDGRRADREGSS